MTDRYSQARRDEHSTLGDALDRYRRDEDAFTAGVQYALDRIVNRRNDVAAVATDVLDDVHAGRL